MSERAESPLVNDTFPPRQIRAPRQHGETVIVPPLSHVGNLLQKNRVHLSTDDSLWRERLVVLRASARENLIALATVYTSQYRDVPTAASFVTTPIILSGHQPQLFHAGVWFKNFVLSQTAQAESAVGINLIVDNDTVRTPSIRVPAGNEQSPFLESVPFDSASRELPFEQRSIQDRDLFASFAQRVQGVLQPWIDDPLLSTLWPLAIRSSRHTTNLGESLSRARHTLEGQWGLQTLEVPLSHVFGQPSFYRFALPILADASAFRLAYNQALADHRRQYHLRSRSHPVPDLDQQDEWLEMPLWVWTNQQPLRKRLYVRPRRSGCELTDREGWQQSLPLRKSEQSFDAAVEAWEQLERQGVKIRPRALMTTLYSRLVLSDLFVHGIGGAKYDDVTDAIIRQYFQITPPHFLTVSGTFQLPLPFHADAEATLQHLQLQRRAMQFHPELFVNHTDTSPLRERKAALLRAIPLGGPNKEWHHELELANADLRARLQDSPPLLEHQLASEAEEVRRAKMLGSREFSFCLFPEHILRPLLLAKSAGKF